MNGEQSSGCITEASYTLVRRVMDKIANVFVESSSMLEPLFFSRSESRRGFYLRRNEPKKKPKRNEKHTNIRNVYDNAGARFFLKSSFNTKLPLSTS